MKLIARFLFPCLLASCVARGDTPGYFSTRQIDGRWWFIDPDGKPFISKGVTTVQYAQDKIRDTSRSPYAETNTAKYGNVGAWREAIAKRLAGWGFNTLGAWSDEKIAQAAAGERHFAYAPTIDFGAKFVAQKSGGAAWLKGIFPDVFDPAFVEFCQREARKFCAPLANDRNVLGWFTDNELRWGPDWRGSDELLTEFLNFPAGTPGRAAAIRLLSERHGHDVARLNKVWKTDFADWDALERAGKIHAPFERRALAAQNSEAERAVGSAFLADCDAFLAELSDRYFSAVCRAIGAADSHHLIFGCRFAYVPAVPVVAAAGKSLDAISFNCYENDPTGTIARYSVFKKPLIIGEFAFRAGDSGLPNTKGAGTIVPTQPDRAACYERYVRAALAQPNLVGYHWFEHADEPAEGRFDGENSNYGLVNIHDEPYEILTQKMTGLNQQAEALHRAPSAAQ